MRFRRERVYEYVRREEGERPPKLRWSQFSTSPILAGHGERILPAGIGILTVRGFLADCEVGSSVRAVGNEEHRGAKHKRVFGGTPQSLASAAIEKARRWDDSRVRVCRGGRLGLDPAIHNKLRRRRGNVVLLALISCAFLSWSPSSPATVPSTASLPSVSTAPQQPTTPRPLEQVLALANPSLSRGERLRIVAAIDRYSAHYELDPDLVMAIVLVESNARPWARSPKGAVGLMQVMPHMMRPMGLAGNLATVETNIEAGCFILANNIERLGVERGISAYFWGSRIRGVAYLEKVLEARARVRELRTS